MSLRVWIQNFAAVAMMLILTAGCGRWASAKDDGRIVLGFIVKQPEEPWFQDEWAFAQQAANEDGFDLIKIGAPDGQRVLSAIDDLAARGAKGFVICTPDVKLGPAIMEKANSYNMKVFTVDDRFVGSDGKFMDVPYMGISAFDIGRLVGKSLAQELKRRGWIISDTAACCICYDEVDTLRQRTDGAIAALIESGFPKQQIFREPEKTTDTPGAFDAASVLLTRHPEFRTWLVFSVNDEGVLGALRAMEGRGFHANDVIGIGIGGTTGVIDFKNPKPTGFYASVLLSPRRHGYESIQYLYKWVKYGIAPPGQIFTTGTLITRQNYRQVMIQQGMPNP